MGYWNIQLITIELLLEEWTKEPPRERKNASLAKRTATNIVTPHTWVFQMSHPAYYPLIHIPHSPKTAYLSTILRKITFRKFIATGKGAKYNCWRREQLRDIGEAWERLGFGIATRLSHCGCLHLLQIENEGKTPRNQRTNPRNSNCRKGGKRLKILKTFWHDEFHLMT